MTPAPIRAARQPGARADRLFRLGAAALALAAAGTVSAYPLDLQHSPAGHFDRSYSWSIASSVFPPTADLHPGDHQLYDYRFSVTKGAAVDAGHRVDGQVSIGNPGALAADIVSISVSVGGTAVAPDCSGFAPPAVLAPGATVHCSYSIPVAGSTPLQATLDVGTSGEVSGGQLAANVVFATPDTTGHDTITVTSADHSGSWTFADSGSASYSVQHGCVDNMSQVLNHSATIVELEQSSSTTARLYCHVMRLYKSADLQLSRHWSWHIDKQHDEHPPLLLTEGQAYVVPYRITATATAGDSNINVSGVVQVWNGNPVKPAVLLSVIDDLQGVGFIPLDCPALVVAPLATMHCTYSSPLPDTSVRLNTATATQQNHLYAVDGSATANGDTRLYHGTAKLYFDDAETSETDACAAVSDIYLEQSHDLGVVCAEQSPVLLAFDGAIQVHSHSACAFDITNIARLVTADTGASHEANTSIAVERADCDPLVGCVLSAGYWKTHSRLGPASHDTTWNLIGEDSPFFLAMDSSGQVLGWHDVTGMPPRGNAYFILSRQFVAATLNTLNGASASEQVLDALAEAQALFETYSVAQLADLRGNDAPRPRFMELAGILDMYNNGIGDIGPPSCSEDDAS
jgi:hypothetical protein